MIFTNFRLISFAEVAKSHNYVRPKFTDSLEIEIIGGRHPLLEHYKQIKVIPNDYISKPGSPLIITGTNCCGKSIYLKQNCLILFLAHLGSFVPATSCTVGVVSKIFSKIYRNDSISTGVGSFFFEMNKVSDILTYADRETFVAIDELGRTTNSKDGISILLTTLRNFLSDQFNSPYLTILTHFYKIIGLLNVKNLSYKTFQITQTENNIRYEYKLQDGFVEDSIVFTAMCSLLNDLDLQARMEKLLQNTREKKPVRFSLLPEREREFKQVLDMERTVRNQFSSQEQ